MDVFEELGDGKFIPESCVREALVQLGHENPDDGAVDEEETVAKPADKQPKSEAGRKSIVEEKAARKTLAEEMTSVIQTGLAAGRKARYTRRTSRMHRKKERDGEDDENSDDDDNDEGNEVEAQACKKTASVRFANFSEQGDDEPVDFDTFVDIADTCRQAFIRSQSKGCGFTDCELSRMIEVFEMFGTDGSGEIDVHELQEILYYFQWQPKTRDEQAALIRKIERACALAEEAGIPGEMGVDCMPIWAFVQLVRILKSEHEAQEERRITLARKETGFTERETEEFRTIFTDALEKEKEKEQDNQTVDDSDANPVAGFIAVEQLEAKSIRRLIRGLGVHIIGKTGEKLYDQFQKYDPKGRRENGTIDFANFLRLMKWLIKSDFGDINQTASEFLARRRAAEAAEAAEPPSP